MPTNMLARTTLRVSSLPFAACGRACLSTTVDTTRTPQSNPVTPGAPTPAPSHKRHSRIDPMQLLPNPTNHNAHLIDMLKAYQRRRYLESDAYRVRAYSHAVLALRAHPTRIETGAEADRLPGIGQSIAGKIDLFLRTGEVETAADARLKVIEALCEIDGIGPKTAANMHDDYHVRELDDLENNVPMTTRIRMGIKYREEFARSIPEEEMREWEELVRRSAAGFEVDVSRVWGEEARRVDAMLMHPRYVEEKDVVAAEDSLARVMNNVKRARVITDDITSRGGSYQGVGQLHDGPHRRINVLVLPSETFWAAVVHATGSTLFNVWLAMVAAKKGLDWTKRGLARAGGGPAVRIGSEKEVFDVLELPWMERAQRNW